MSDDEQQQQQKQQQEQPQVQQKRVLIPVITEHAAFYQAAMEADPTARALCFGAPADQHAKMRAWVLENLMVPLDDDHTFDELHAWKPAPAAAAAASGEQQLAGSLSLPESICDEVSSAVLAAFLAQEQRAAELEARQFLVTLIFALDRIASSMADTEEEELKDVAGNAVYAKLCLLEVVQAWWQ
jgi:hypothetical protein